MMSAVSLFSGAGGMDIGIQQAGFNILACVENDPYCCETLRVNVQREGRDTLIAEEDIRKIDPLQVLDILRIEPGDLDLLCGGPPCQAFSQIGKRLSLNDERGMLLFEMTRFAKVLRPKAILIEQVKGLLNALDHDGRPGGVFEMLLNELRDLGYVSKWKVVHAVDYGVPQMRQRVFIVCMLERNSFAFPMPTHVASSNDLPLFGLPQYRTVGDVLEGLPSPVTKEDYQGEDSHVDITPAGDKRRIHGVPEGAHLAAQLHLSVEQRCNLTRKDTTKFRRMHRNEPAITLRCGEVFFHPIEDRYLTVREYMRIHTYPDSYILKGAIRGRSGRVRLLDQYRQVANSVPPLVAKQIAEAIRQALLDQQIQVEEGIEVARST
jgi:DNA (cytosine-5)-methyltransferase 1